MSKAVSYLSVLRTVLILAALNSLLFHGLNYLFPGVANEVGLNLVRMLLTVYAGWLVIDKSIGCLWGAALGGALVLFVDHPLVTGAYFLILGELQAFGGVMLSFVMFVWVPMLFGAGGGALRKRKAS